MNALRNWIYWKTKIRVRQLWENFSMFNLENNKRAFFISIFFNLIGIMVMFFLGFGGAYFYKKFISNNPYFLWQIFFIFTYIFEAIVSGINSGNHILSTKEDEWLISTLNFTRIKYVIYVWIDSSLANIKNTLISNLAAILGILIVFPTSILNFLIFMIVGLAVFILLSLITTIVIYIKGYYKNKIFISNVYSIILFVLLLIIPIKFINEISNFLTFIYLFITNPSNVSLIQEFSLNNLVKDFYSFISIWINSNLLLTNILGNVMNGDIDSLTFPIILLYLLLLLLIALLGLYNLRKLDFFENHSVSFLNNLFSYIYKKISTKNKSKQNVLIFYMTHRILNSPNVKIAFTILNLKMVSLLVFFYFLLRSLEIRDFSLLLLLFLAIRLPILINSNLYKKSYIFLHMDSDKREVESLLLKGFTMQEIFKAKCRSFRLLNLINSLIMVVFFLTLHIDWLFKLILIFIILIIQLLLYEYNLLHSFLIMHFNKKNKNKFVKLPDQQKMKSSIHSFVSILLIPVPIFITFFTQNMSINTVFILTMLWVIIMGTIVKLTIIFLIRKKEKNISIEELYYNNSINGYEKSWNKIVWKVLLAICLIILSFLLIKNGLVILGSLSYMFTFFIYNMIFLTSFNRRNVK